MTKQKASAEAKEAGGAQSEVAQYNSNPSLLSIPAELRNHIYRYALVEEGEIRVDAPHRTQPALLCTCRQIREEASGILFGENRFTTPVMDLEWPVPTDHWFNKHVGDDAELTIRLHGVQKWANLEAWLQRYHSRELRGIGHSESQEWEVVAKAFEIVAVLKRTPWETVQKVVQKYKEGVDLTDGSWTWA
ncbi:hypothetical protein LTR36_008567 [Oleoguttula mirabilis]|uniref:Uncharacterized protein n=1 Tax=Oleoguttula mirabilis TaxID=1507867 RepID=A0AAV9JTF1_9PEZI|nr:hypothetical protein LTR36_008567 [Oleoguttula mirabilis]